MIDAVPNDNGHESFVGKARRHVLNKDFSPQMLRRGLNHAWAELLLINMYYAQVEYERRGRRVMGIPGYNLDEYSVRVPAPLNFGRRERFMAVPVRVYTFPENSRLNAFVTDENNSSLIKTTEFAFKLGIPDAIATFSGPTFPLFGVNGGNGLPNNGCYFKKYGLMVPFQETEPNGLRRGAFVLKEGSVEAITDPKKWEFVNDDFKGIDALIGTSHYILPLIDAGFINQPNQPIDIDIQRKSNLSYLLSYKDDQGRNRFSLAISQSFIDTHIMIQVLADYLLKRASTSQDSISSAVAVELERSGSYMQAIGRKKSNIFGGSGFFERRDHYVVTRI